MEQAEEMQVGKVTHYFTKIGVAVIEVTDGSIKVGDEIHIKGHTSDFKQKVTSMQIEHEKVEMAEPGQSIGLKVNEPVRANDLVYKEM
jgi:translation elongation factor EF-1alpha